MHAILALSSVLLGAALSTPQVPRATQPPPLLVSWSGGDAGRDDRHFVSFTNTKEFEAVWDELVFRSSSAHGTADYLRPRIDFAACAGFALTGGKTWNSKGYRHLGTELVDGAWHVRLLQDTWMGHGAAQESRPWAIFLVPRTAGATFVVDEDVKERVDEAPKWKELGRLVIPPLVGAVAPPDTERFAPRVLAAIADYGKLARVSDLPNWSPLDCRAPPVPGPFVSASEDRDSHGRKLYFLYVRDADAYRGKSKIRAGDEHWSNTVTPPVDPAPVGQLIVKEAWHPVLETGAAPEAKRGYGLPDTHAQLDGKLYARGAQAELFVMLKLDPQTPDTDRGWVYATVAPDRRTVTAAGRIASCMGCHVDAAHDRQFGIPGEWAAMRYAPSGR